MSIPYPPSKPLQRSLVSLAGAHTNYFRNRRDEYLAVANRALFGTSGGVQNGLNDFFLVGFRHHRGYQRLWQRRSGDIRSTTAGEDLNTLLLATTINVLHIETAAANFVERRDNDVYSIGSNNSFNFYHF